MRKILCYKKHVIIFFMIVIILIFANIVYAAYINNISVKYSAISGEMICNIDIDKNEIKTKVYSCFLMI